MLTRIAGLAAVVIAALYFLLPPRADDAPPAPAGSSIRGVVHIHTRRSDGTGTVEDVARAAARAGLAFVVITDHGDGTRRPDPPAYIDGVLVIDAVEVSTYGGHAVALGLSEAPYPLGGEAGDVVDDVHRLGGWAIAAHPGSPKPELAWRDWRVPVDGLEWLNVDSEWRDERATTLARVLLSYPFRPAEAVTALFDRPDSVMARWDELSAVQPVVGLAGADAHARLGLTSIGEPYDSRVSLPLPSYAAVFSALSMSLDDVVLRRDADADAAAVLGALRSGRFYSTVDGIAKGGTLHFSASSGAQQARMGQRLLADGPVILRADAGGAPNVSVRLLRNGRLLRTADAGALEETVSAEAATYRIEVYAPRASGMPPVPWIVGNPIYVGAGRRDAPEPVISPRAHLAFTREQLARARIERSVSAEGAVSVTAAADVRELLYRYAFGGRLSENPYVAAVLPLPAALTIDSQLRFAVRADRPMRLSVQLRHPGPGDGERWRTSIYVDEMLREVVIPVRELRPVDDVPIDDRLATIDSLLFVVDAVNTRLGTSGRVWIRELETAK